LGSTSKNSIIELLVLDRWELIWLDALTRETLMEVLDNRGNWRTTLVTSQLPVDHWHAWVNASAIADAMLDRLLARVHRIMFKGDSLRASKPK